MIRTLILLVAGALTLPCEAAAQVGHPPASSPYADYANGHSITALFGYFGGSGGRFGAGAHGGTTVGGRYDVRAGKPVQLGFAVASGSLERVIVDPFVALANRFSEPVDQRVTFFDVGAQLNLTGGKSWNRLAPFAGLALGIAIASDTPADTSGYEFGTKFYFAPNAGVRVFLSPRLHLRADARATFWKVNYPNSFAAEPVEEPGTPDEPNAVISEGSLSEWSLTPWLQVGLGYTIRW